MKWARSSDNCVSSNLGYVIGAHEAKNTNNESLIAFIARSPESKLLYSGLDPDKAKAACVEHFELIMGKAA